MCSNVLPALARGGRESETGSTATPAAARLPDSPPRERLAAHRHAPTVHCVNGAPVVGSLASLLVTHWPVAAVKP